MDRTLLGLMFLNKLLQSLLPKIPSLHTSRAVKIRLCIIFEALDRAEPNRDGQANAVLFLSSRFQRGADRRMLEKGSETSSLHSDIRWNRRGKLGQQVIEKGITYRKTGSLRRSGNLEQISIGYGRLKINIELTELSACFSLSTRRQHVPRAAAARLAFPIAQPWLPLYACS